jgi:transposase InsO family protein
LLIDLCSREIVGWAVSRRCDAALAVNALQCAVARAAPPPGLIHHTDRGSTYTADAYRKELEGLGFVVSMSRVGNCWDNAVAESTFSTIKAELFEGWLPEGLHDVRGALFEYIELFYNRRRIHSSIGYITPAEKKRQASQLGVAA